jgi:hypothetical protein
MRTPKVLERLILEYLNLGTAIRVIAVRKNLEIEQFNRWVRKYRTNGIHGLEMPNRGATICDYKKGDPIKSGGTKKNMCLSKILKNDVGCLVH